jgi:hypothetical protein
MNSLAHSIDIDDQEDPDQVEDDDDDDDNDSQNDYYENNEFAQSMPAHFAQSL